MYNYSIIIPHYNSVDFLQRCLDSIPYRDDLQIIIVDDNSNPNKVDFNSFPGQDREHVKLILSKEGKGAGYARNLGIEQSEGKWLIFSDADDVFCTDTLNSMMDKYVQDLNDIVFFNVDVINAKNGCYENNRLEIRSHITRGNQEDIAWFRYGLTVPWGKFVKKSLVQEYKILFDEVIAGNDVMFSLKSGYYAKSVKLDKAIIYKWYYYTNGNVSSNRTECAALAKFGVSVRRNDFLERNNRELYRSNLFITYIPFFSEIGYSIIKSFVSIIKVTPKKYWFKDVCEFMFFSSKHLLNKIKDFRKS